MGIQTFGPAKSPVRATLLTGVTDKFLGNDAGYHTVSYSFTDGSNSSGTAYINNLEVAGNANSTITRNLPANSRVEYFPQMVAANIGISDKINAIAYGSSKYVAGLSTGIAASNDGSTWVKYSWPYIGQIRSMIYNAGMYVAVGGNFSQSQAVIATSPDLINWTRRTAPVVDAIYNSILFANNLYVVTNSNSSNLATSPDGITWTNRTTNISTAIGITYGASGWYFASTFNVMRYSTDGINWTIKTNTLSTQPVYAVEYGNGVYVAAGAAGTVANATTPGGTWTLRTSQFGTTPIKSLAYGAGVFVAVGDSGKISTSPDGTTWTARTSGTTDPLVNVSFINNHFLLRANTGIIKYSTDGITWTAKASGPGGDNDTADQNTLYVNGEYIVAIGNVFYKSTDLNSWARLGGYVATSVAFLHFKNNLFYAWYPGGAGMMTSADAIWWTPSGGSIGFDVSYANGTAKWMTGGLLSSSYSDDLVTWTSSGNPFPTAADQNYTAVAAAHNGTIAVAGSSQYVASSTNGTPGLTAISSNLSTWTLTTNPFTGQGLNIPWIQYGNGIFVALGTSVTPFGDGNSYFLSTEDGILNTALMTSPDGITWTQRVAPNATTANPKDLLFLNNQFVLVQGNTNGGFLSTSNDGINWKRRTSNITTRLRSATFMGISPIAAGDSGNIIKENPSPASAVMLTNNYGEAKTLV